MKTVLLMRHADANSVDVTELGNDRPVSVTGLFQIEQIKNAARDMYRDIDFVLCSGLKRARQTLQAIDPIISQNARIMFDDLLYKNSALDLLDRIQWTPAIYGKILIIGHNPGLSLFVEAISPHGNAEKLTTCELVALEVSTETWCEASYRTFSITKRVAPNVHWNL
jgi:phosphohistidine phosphatase